MSDETAAPQPQIKISWLIGIAVAFALFAAIGGYSARMTRDYSDYDQDRATQRYATLAKLQADENKQLNPVDAAGKPSAIWIDQDKDIISIPIEEAMAKEVDDIKAKTCGPGCEINPAAPSGAPAAPAPAAPATNAAPAAPEPKPAQPEKPGKPATAALQERTEARVVLTSGIINQPVFNTRRIKAQSGVDVVPFDGFITYGGIHIATENSAVSHVAAAPTN